MEVDELALEGLAPEAEEEEGEEGEEGEEEAVVVALAESNNLWQSLLNTD